MGISARKALGSRWFGCRPAEPGAAFRAWFVSVPGRVPGSSGFFGLAVLVLVAGMVGCSPSGDTKVRPPSQIIGSRGRQAGRFVKPRAIAANRWNEVFIVDRSGRVQKIDAEGRSLLSWQLEKVDSGYPTGLCCDATGDLWVADTHNSRILHYSRSGELLGRFGQHGVEPGQLVYPADVLVGDGDSVYVSDYGGQGRDRIAVFRRDGSFVQEWGGTGREPGELQRAMGLCFDPEGNLWVADSCNHRLQLFTPEGVFVRLIGGQGANGRMFSYPYDVALDAAGNLVVSEFGSNRVQVVSRDGRSLAVWGQPGAAPGEFHEPWGICVLRGRIFVVDALNDRVQVFAG